MPDKRQSSGGPHQLYLIAMDFGERYESFSIIFLSLHPLFLGTTKSFTAKRNCQMLSHSSYRCSSPDSKIPHEMILEFL